MLATNNHKSLLRQRCETYSSIDLGTDLVVFVSDKQSQFFVTEDMQILFLCWSWCVFLWYTVINYDVKIIFAPILRGRHAKWWCLFEVLSDCGCNSKKGGGLSDMIILLVFWSHKIILYIICFSNFIKVVFWTEN